MFNIQYIAIFAVISLLIDLLVKKAVIRNILSSLLICIGFYIGNVQILYALPIYFFLAVSFTNKNIKINLIKTLSFILLAYENVSFGFWNILIIFFLLIVPLSYSSMQKQKNSLLVIDFIYSIGLFIAGIWIFMMNQLEGGDNYSN